MADNPDDTAKLAERLLHNNPQRARFTQLNTNTSFTHNTLPLSIGTAPGRTLTVTADHNALETRYAVVTDDNPPMIRAEDRPCRLTYLGVQNFEGINPLLQRDDTTPAYTEQQIATHLHDVNTAIAKQGVTYLAVGDHTTNTYDDQNTTGIIGISNQALYTATQLKNPNEHLPNTTNIRRPPSSTNTAKQDTPHRIDALRGRR